jgi:hypothetical protein
MANFYQLFGEKNAGGNADIGRRGFKIERSWFCDVEFEDLIALLPSLGSAFPDRLTGLPDPRYSAFRVCAISVKSTPGSIGQCVVTISYDCNWDISMTPSRESWKFSMISSTKNVKYVPDGYVMVEPVTDAGKVLNMVNVKKDGSVEGADVYRPNFGIHVRKIWDWISPAGVAYLNAAQNRLNITSWMGFDPQTVLFLGAETSRTDDGLTEVNYDFMAGPYLSDVTVEGINGTLTLPVHCPHDVVWTRDAQATAAVGQPIRSGPITLVANRMYDNLDFSYLGLVGPWEDFSGGSVSGQAPIGEGGGSGQTGAFIPTPVTWNFEGA